MKIGWTEEALNDLSSIRDFIAEDSESRASLTIQRILDAVERLALHPNLGRSGRVAGTRELIVPRTQFLLIYKVREGGIRVLTVLHGRQEWPPKV